MDGKMFLSCFNIADNKKHFNMILTSENILAHLLFIIILSIHPSTMNLKMKIYSQNAKQKV